MDAQETLGEKGNGKEKLTKNNKKRPLENLEDCTSHEKTVTEGCAEMKHRAKRSKGGDESRTKKANREQEVSKHNKNKKVDGVEGVTEHKIQSHGNDIKDKKTMSTECFYPIMDRTKRKRQNNDDDEKQDKRKKHDTEETKNQDKKRKRQVKEDDEKQDKKRKRQVKEEDEKQGKKRKRQVKDDDAKQDNKRQRQDTENDEKKDKKRKRQDAEDDEKQAKKSRGRAG